jgi:Tol biopolymer transport system component
MQNGIPQIFLINTDGSNPQLLVQDLNGACQPAWSPDGKKLVYIAPCADKSDLYPQSSLYVLDLETGKTSSLPASPGGSFEPAWSPDGTKIAFTSIFNNLPQICLIDLNNQAITRLTTASGNVQSRQPAWSPAGKQIVYTVRRFNLQQIWTMNADGTNQVQLVRSGGGASDYMPAWSPDGSFILFSETNENATAPSILMRFVLSTQKVEAVSGPLQVVDVNFSPDGKWIAYETSDTKNQDIYINSLSGGKPQRMTTSPALDFDPAWQPE